MNAVLLFAAAPVLFVVVMSAVIGWDRWREPRRSVYRPIAVVDARTYRDARRQIERLAAAGEWDRAWAGAIGVCQWLSYERNFGSPARRRRLAADLADWSARRAEYNPLDSR